MSDYLQVITTLNTEAAAKQLARDLVQQQVAACVQVVGPIYSTYQWQDQVETATEWQCLIKTRTHFYPALAQQIQDQHPYEVPEIIALPIQHSTAAYLNWLDHTLPPEWPGNFEPPD